MKAIRVIIPSLLQSWISLTEHFARHTKRPITKEPRRSVRSPPSSTCTQDKEEETTVGIFFFSLCLGCVMRIKRLFIFCVSDCVRPQPIWWKVQSSFGPSHGDKKHWHKFKGQKCHSFVSSRQEGGVNSKIWGSKERCPFQETNKRSLYKSSCRISGHLGFTMVQCC